MYAKLNYVKLVIDDSVYWIPPQGYTKRKQNATLETCEIAIVPSAEDGYVYLGMYFLASYYAEFNYAPIPRQVSLGVNSRAAWTAGIGNAADLDPSYSFTVSLINNENTWLGYFFVGTPQQSLKVNYLTSLAQTVIENNSCQFNCSQQEYDPLASNTSTAGFGDYDSLTSDFVSLKSNQT